MAGSHDCMLNTVPATSGHFTGKVGPPPPLTLQDPLATNQWLPRPGPTQPLNVQPHLALPQATHSLAAFLFILNTSNIFFFGYEVVEASQSRMTVSQHRRARGSHAAPPPLVATLRALLTENADESRKSEHDTARAIAVATTPSAGPRARPSECALDD